MNLRIFLLVILLLLLTAVPLYYKTNVLKVGLFPKNLTDFWEVEISRSHHDTESFIPIPEASDRFEITDFQTLGKGLQLDKEQTLSGTVGRWHGTKDSKSDPIYRLQVRSSKKKYKIVKKDVTKIYPKDVMPFLKKIELEDNLAEAIDRLEEELNVSTKNKVKSAKTLYYFIHEEILDTKKTQGISSAILNYKGSSKDKSNLFTVMARRAGIPARTIRGIELRESENMKRPIFYWNEVYLGKKWIPISTTNGLFGKIRKSYIPLYTSTDLTNPQFESGKGKIVYKVQPVTSEKFNYLQYKAELKKRNSPLFKFSPYMLPLAEQVALKLILLFSLGTVVLAVCRNIVGVKSFGIFFPILLALFFKHSSLSFGLVFLAFILLIGFIERRFLKSMYLMLVPRLSIVLTLLVITLVSISILNHNYNFFPDYNPAVLPIIITTMFIERFSIMMEEEGAKNTTISLLGTIIIALAAFVIFSWKTLEIFVYTHPEILFTVIAIHILIGRYTGYRISELIRFREFAKAQS